MLVVVDYSPKKSTTSSQKKSRFLLDGFRYETRFPRKRHVTMEMALSLDVWYGEVKNAFKSAYELLLYSRILATYHTMLFDCVFSRHQFEKNSNCNLLQSHWVSSECFWTLKRESLLIPQKGPGTAKSTNKRPLPGNSRCYWLSIQLEVFPVSAKARASVARFILTGLARSSDASQVEKNGTRTLRTLARLCSMTPWHGIPLMGNLPKLIFVIIVIRCIWRE